jgi:hypothetical protein
MIKEDNMKPVSDDRSPKYQKDRIDGRTIILDSQGEFPKQIIILEAEKELKYRIIKTRKGKYLFN